MYRNKRNMGKRVSIRCRRSSLLSRAFSLLNCACWLLVYGGTYDSLHSQYVYSDWVLLGGQPRARKTSQVHVLHRKTPTGSLLHL